MAGEITQLLADIRAGDNGAESRLVSLVYDELHRMAARYMNRERSGHTLQATVLVHEAYMRLVAQEDQNWQNRSHFFSMAAQLMRRILIDHARSRGAQKRGGTKVKLPLEDALVAGEYNCEELIEVDDALNRLSRRDPRLGQIVELRFFAGLTEEEIAEMLGISARTVKRDWKVARLWLHSQLSSPQTS